MLQPTETLVKYCNVIRHIKQASGRLLDAKLKSGSTSLFTSSRIWPMLLRSDSTNPGPGHLLPQSRRAPHPNFSVVSVSHCTASLGHYTCYGRLSAPASAITKYDAPTTETELPSCLTYRQRAVARDVNSGSQVTRRRRETEREGLRSRWR
jgi:hypothetical protein